MPCTREGSQGVAQGRGKARGTSPSDLERNRNGFEIFDFFIFSMIFPSLALNGKYRSDEAGRAGGVE